MTIPIPPDEALLNAYTKEKECLHADGLRAVATLAAKQAAEQAVKEAVLRIDEWARGVGYPYVAVNDYGLEQMLRRDFPSAFTSTPPKEQPVFPLSSGTPQPGDAPTPTIPPQPNPSPDPATVRLDEATVRACIDILNKHGYDDEIATRALEALLPKPTPAPEPERYVTVEEVADAMKDIGGTLVASRCAVLSRLDKHAAKRGPMLTPERAVASMRAVFSNVTAKESDELLTALRLAAKQGGGE